MRFASRIGSGLFALGAFGSAFLLGASARAQGSPTGECPECVIVTQPTTTVETPCLTVITSYVPARYEGFAAGDVALNNASGNGTITPDQTSPSMGNLIAEAVIQNLGGPTAAHDYFHAKELFDPSGQDFSETFPAGTLPSSHQTGESNECSSVISPYFLDQYPPGAGVYYEDAEPGVVVRGIATPGCIPPANSYHLASIIYDSIPGGSCEKELVDYCGVPVTYNAPGAPGDRTTYTTQEALNAVSALWSEVYGLCISTESISWLDSVACDGLTAQLACQRASWQVVNASFYLARPLQTDAGWDSNGPGTDFDFPGVAPTPLSGPYPPVNFYKTTGTVLLGASKTIWESMPNGNLCPGACNSGNCQTVPTMGAWSCPNSAYEPPAFVLNIPENINNAAARLGKTVTTVGLNSGIAAGYYSYTDVYHPGATCIDMQGGTSTCLANGECYNPPKAGGGPAVVK